MEIEQESIEMIIDIPSIDNLILISEYFINEVLPDYLKGINNEQIAPTLRNL